jgi:hypothetical protein
MALLVRIEKRASRGECQAFTLGGLVNVGSLIVTPEPLLTSLTVAVPTLRPFESFSSTVTGLPAAWIAAPETRLTTATAIAILS